MRSRFRRRRRAAAQSPIAMWTDLAASAFTPAPGSRRDVPEERAKALARRKKPQTARRRTDVQATRTERPSRQRRRWWERTFGTPYTGQLTEAEEEARR